MCFTPQLKSLYQKFYKSSGDDRSLQPQRTYLSPVCNELPPYLEIENILQTNNYTSTLSTTHTLGNQSIKNLQVGTTSLVRPVAQLGHSIIKAKNALFEQDQWQATLPGHGMSTQ